MDRRSLKDGGVSFKNKTAMIKAVKKEGFFGVEEDGRVLVPYAHSTKGEAIDEWVYFETLNTKSNWFLNEIKTGEQIKKIALELNEM